MVSQRQKMMISIMSGLLFFIVANPETFKLVRRVLGGWVSSPTGCPTVPGLVVHAIVYFLLTWALMNMKQNRESADGDTMTNGGDGDKDMMTNGGDGGKDMMTDGDSGASTRRLGDALGDGTMTNGDTPQPFNSDDGDDELAGIDTTFKLDLGSPHDQLSQYNRCACADGTEVLVLK